MNDTLSDDDRDIDIESDDDDNDDSDTRSQSGRGTNTQHFSQAEKRAHHNALERKRRDHIKDSFTSLRESVPSLAGDKSVNVEGPANSRQSKASRAQILRKAAEYIGYMRRKNNSHQQNIDDLKRQNSILETQIRQLEQERDNLSANGELGRADEITESEVEDDEEEENDDEEDDDDEDDPDQGDDNADEKQRRQLNGGNKAVDDDDMEAEGGDDENDDDDDDEDDDDDDDDDEDDEDDDNEQRRRRQRSTAAAMGGKK